jgi:hypothetical protein
MRYRVIDSSWTGHKIIDEEGRTAWVSSALVSRYDIEKDGMYISIGPRYAGIVEDKLDDDPRKYDVSFRHPTPDQKYKEHRKND